MDYIAGLHGIDELDRFADADTRCFLGPETNLKPTDPVTNDPATVFEILAEPWELITDRPISQAVVIIDAGIAFWNRRFRGLAGPRFRGMRFFDFDQPNAPSNLLTDVDIAAYCDMANWKGNAAVMQRLGALYPNSVFGQAANPDPDGLWHGTAIADLAAGAEVGTADDIALFGLELPRAVIADYSGGILSVTLAMILPAAIAMTKDLADKLTIVMPLGFPAGPQDGSHPAAVAIDRAMAGSGRNNVRLVLPAGNHLQDRCHARLTGGGARTSVHWDLPPEDYSTNTVAMFGVAGQPVSLAVAAPGQAVASSVKMPQASYCFAVQNDKKIGVLVRALDTPSWSRTGLALWQTAVTKDDNGASYGRWTLSSVEDMDLWLARDDRDPVADRGRPRRPSRFWDAGYTRNDANGALMQSDDPGSVIKRTGTLSVLATARNSNVFAVRAMERLGTGGPEPSGYSSRREDGKPVPNAAMVDEGWPHRGTMAAANGGQRRVRVSGTSAAAGLFARIPILP